MSDIEAWEEPVKEVTLSELNKICEEYAEARACKKAAEAEVDKIGENVKALENRILTILKENNMPNYKCGVGTISVKNSKSVSQPASLAEKLALFDYLRSQGIFEEMVNVNSRTLSSWANKEIEAKEKEGVFGWAPPGLKPPETFQSISFSAKKG